MSVAHLMLVPLFSVPPSSSEESDWDEGNEHHSWSLDVSTKWFDRRKDISAWALDCSTLGDWAGGECVPYWSSGGSSIDAGIGGYGAWAGSGAEGVGESGAACSNLAGRIISAGNSCYIGSVIGPSIAVDCVDAIPCVVDATDIEGNTIEPDWSANLGRSSY